MLCGADLTPLFHWNTKQLFVYLVAEYATPRHVRPALASTPLPASHEPARHGGAPGALVLHWWVAHMYSS